MPSFPIACSKCRFAVLWGIRSGLSNEARTCFIKLCLYAHHRSGYPEVFSSNRKSSLFIFSLIWSLFLLCYLLSTSFPIRQKKRFLFWTSVCRTLLLPKSAKLPLVVSGSNIRPRSWLKAVNKSIGFTLGLVNWMCILQPLSCCSATEISSFCTRCRSKIWVADTSCLGINRPCPYVLQNNIFKQDFHSKRKLINRQLPSEVLLNI